MELKIKKAIFADGIKVLPVSDVTLDKCPVCGVVPLVLHSPGSNCGSDEYMVTCGSELTQCNFHNMNTIWLPSVGAAVREWNWVEDPDKAWRRGKVGLGYRYSIWNSLYWNLNAALRLENPVAYKGSLCSDERQLIGFFIDGKTPKEAIDILVRNRQIESIL